MGFPGREALLLKLRERLTEAAARAAPEPPRLALIGAGQELRGDDAAGIEVLRQIKAKISTCEHILTLEAGPAPENLTGPLVRFRPHLALIFDAAALDGPPGACCLLDAHDLDHSSLGTHALSLSLFARYLTQQTGCDLALVGIQPAQMDLCMPLSPPVSTAVRELSALVSELLLTGDY